MDKFSQDKTNPSGYKYKDKNTNPFFSYSDSTSTASEIYPTPGEVGQVLTVKSPFLPTHPTKDDLEWKYIDSQAMIIHNDEDALNKLYNNVGGVDGHYYALKYTNSKFFIEDITEKLGVL